ncbi:hypothetical protein K466DRAFT_607682 [Polyporus arcularius HHB13444]|uniref:Uncharacterized protein n=1 Tax=Polyporus arcularius HHB13444 TaxID=1314778 RepID=A0A5C3NPC7_9APHY|nr:hypothetical protein K466DRAFT_607682 [Polyporus arcularius HHB13444]
MAQLSLNGQETEHLESVLQSWTSKSRTEKSAFKEELISKFLKDRGLDTANLWMRFVLRVKIGTWFSNHVPAAEPRLPRSLRAHWTAREVFYEQEAERIQLRQEELKSEGTHPLAALNKARSQTWNELSDEEKDGYSATADLWTAQGPDNAELRAQIAEKRGPGWSHGYADLWYTQANAVGLHLFFYLDKEGRLRSGHYDTSELFDDSSVKKFTELYPNWHKNIFDCLGKYAATVLLPDDDDNVADPPPVKANKVVLEFDDNGIPILPTEENGKAITLVGRRQTIMRAYMNANYSAARRVPDSSVPWARLKSHPDDFFAEGLVPDGVELGDPAHMRAEHLDPLWNRILEIQASEEGSERFTFRQWWDPASKRYFKTRYAGETDDEGDGAPVPTKKGKKSSNSCIIFKSS